MVRRVRNKTWKRSPIGEAVVYKETMTKTVCSQTPTVETFPLQTTFFTGAGLIVSTGFFYASETESNGWRVDRDSHFSVRLSSTEEVSVVVLEPADTIRFGAARSRAFRGDGHIFAAHTWIHAQTREVMALAAQTAPQEVVAPKEEAFGWVSSGDRDGIVTIETCEVSTPDGKYQAQITKRHLGRFNMQLRYIDDVETAGRIVRVDSFDSLGAAKKAAEQAIRAGERPAEEASAGWRGPQVGATLLTKRQVDRTQGA